MKGSTREAVRIAAGMLIALILFFGILGWALIGSADGAVLPIRASYVVDKSYCNWDSLGVTMYYKGSAEKDTLFTSPICSLNVIIGVDSVGDYFVRNVYYVTDGILVEDYLSTSYYTPWPVTMLVDTAAIGRTVWDNDIVGQASRIVGYVDSVDTIIRPFVAIAVVDTEAVARSTWNEAIIAEADRTIGNAGGAGPGGYACSLYVQKSGAAVQDVTVRLLNTAGDSEIGRLPVDANGRAIFSVPNETYLVYVSKAGLTQTVLPETVVVSADGVSDTVAVTEFDPGNPPQPGLCRVYGYVTDLMAEGVLAKITAEADSTTIFYEGLVISHYSVVDTADDDGYWYLDLFKSDSINSAYKFQVYLGIKAIRTIGDYSVPDSTTHWFIGQ